MKGRLAGTLVCMALMGVFFSVPVSYVFAQTPPATTNTSATPVVDTCDGSWYWPGWLSSTHCFFRPMVSTFGGMIIALAGWTLGVAGLLFNYLIDTTIVGFGTLYNSSLITGVETGWAAFRDVANIAIIGAFVFVAISTILGSNSYGVRQFLARILIAAILINFSIFFAKFSIDVSHIVAAQFDKAIDMGRPEATISTTQIDSPPGIAGSFFSAMKITSAWKSDEIVAKVAQNNGLASAFIYILFVSTVFFAAALILLYGAFLLVVRIVMLIFLLLVSALAFGSMAIPGFTEWWDKWLEEFLKNVLFGPLLIMFLWATLTIANTLSNTSGSLTDLVSKPGSPIGIALLLNYLIVLGLLYGSIKIAQSLSVTGANKLPNWQKSLRLGTLTPAKLAAGTLGFAARQSIGRGADRLKGRYGSGLEDAANKPGASRVERGLSRLALKTLDGTRSASFNANRMPGVMKDIGSNIAKQFKGDGKGGFAGNEEFKAKQKAENQKKAIDEAAKSAAPTDKEKKDNFQRAAYTAAERKAKDEADKNVGTHTSERDQIKADLQKILRKETETTITPAERTRKETLEKRLGVKDAVITEAKKAAVAANKTLVEKWDEFKPNDSAHVAQVEAHLSHPEEGAKNMAEAFKVASDKAKSDSEDRLSKSLGSLSRSRDWKDRLTMGKGTSDSYRHQELLQRFKVDKEKKDKLEGFESLAKVIKESGKKE